MSFVAGGAPELVQIVRYDEAVERLELGIADDSVDIDAADREFAEIEADLQAQ